MSVILEANYSKKLGLPGYSSHQFMLTVRTELSDLTQVGAESARLYTLLQTSVDKELQQPGFLPAAPNGNGNKPASPPNGNGHTNGHGRPEEAWNCSPKQRDLILKIVDEHHLDKGVIEHLAQERFGKGVKALNKLEASGLIDELFATYSPRPRGNGPQKAGAR